ncbi:MAG: hypothetical protein EXS35_08235 [Pedosphaera sp.]|nr:hypothetical protein [Pedosphaera sp.]
MKMRLPFLTALALCASLFTARAVTKAEDSPTPVASKAPGNQFAHSISTITGVAISPLLGTGAYGFVQWWKAPKEERAKLPWFAQPLFFVPALLLVGACFIKDTAGTALPTALKKPLDVAETIEHKISGLVATGAFVPFVASMMSDPSGPHSMLSSMGFAAADFSWLYNIIIVPVMMVAFFIVFLASNAINILILLSPFTTVDAALKTFRTAILGTVVASAWVNPMVGAAWALIIIGIAWLISGWSFRLSHFGMVFVWDFCTLRSSRFTPDKSENKMFLWRKINKVPARTYGKLKRDEKGNLVLTYRPWLVFPARTLVLPEGKYAVGKAVFWQSLQLVDGEHSRNMILLPPRYRGHAEELVKIYNLTGVREAGLLRA